MIFKEILGASVALWLAAAPAFAGNSTDDALLGAFDAYRAGDPIRFAKHAQKLSHHVLEPWLEYWRLSLRRSTAATTWRCAATAGHRACSAATKAPTPRRRRRCGSSRASCPKAAASSPTR